MMVLKKAEIEVSLQEEQQLIQTGAIKEDNPLDLSEKFFKLCESCRRGDLKGCQEALSDGANINARDPFDYTPLILASLCGHYEVVQLLLESGALCERDTFQGERCLYNALNVKIRNLLLECDYSKTSDPLQPLAAHITSLLTRDHPQTSDILVTGAGDPFRLHKFILCARSPYFSRKLAAASDASTWKLPSTLPPQAFSIAIRYLYFGEIPSDIGGGPGTGFSEAEVLEGIDKISKYLEIRTLLDDILEGHDRRYARQRRLLEVEKGRDQIESWFTDNVLKHRVVTNEHCADNVRWDRSNGIFADVLLRADDPTDTEEWSERIDTDLEEDPYAFSNGIPVGPLMKSSQPSAPSLSPRRSILFPVHKAMLVRSEYFAAMFSSSFRESRSLEYLQIIKVDCAPEVLGIVLKFLYTEKTDMPLELALDVMYAADLLLMDKLKMRAAVVISTLGSGSFTRIPARLDASEPGKPSKTNDEAAELDVYEIIRAGWQLRTPRLEEFGARYIALRLESFIDEPEFEVIVRESAERILARQETDTIELLDDIRYYLSERYRLRFEDAGIEGMIDEETEAAEAKGWRAHAPDWVPEHDAVHSPQHEAGDHERRGLELDNGQGGQVAAAASGRIRTLDGGEVEDELEGEAMDYQILLGKIDRLLDRLKLDA